jgi:hypothetical protein
VRLEREDTELGAAVFIKPEDWATVGLDLVGLGGGGELSWSFVVATSPSKSATRCPLPLGTFPGDHDNFVVEVVEIPGGLLVSCSVSVFRSPYSCRHCPIPRPL